jgi:hypothetical protein
MIPEVPVLETPTCLAIASLFCCFIPYLENGIFQILHKTTKPAAIAAGCCLS